MMCVGNKTCWTRFDRRWAPSSEHKAFGPSLPNDPLKTLELSRVVCLLELDARNIRAENCKTIQNFKGNLKDARHKKLQCQICGKVFDVWSRLRDHLYQHLPGRHFSCKVCKKTYKYFEGLRSHSRTHDEHQAHKCSICGKRFPHLSAMQLHRRTHDKLKLFNCTDCNRSFCQKGQLKTHLRIHTGEEPFRCDVCMKRFKHASSRDYHVKLESCTKTVPQLRQLKTVEIARGSQSMQSRRKWVISPSSGLMESNCVPNFGEELLNSHGLSAHPNATGFSKATMQFSAAKSTYISLLESEPLQTLRAATVHER